MWNIRFHWRYDAIRIEPPPAVGRIGGIFSFRFLFPMLIFRRTHIYRWFNRIDTVWIKTSNTTDTHSLTSSIHTQCFFLFVLCVFAQKSYYFHNKKNHRLKLPIVFRCVCVCGKPTCVLEFKCSVDYNAREYLQLKYCKSSCWFSLFFSLSN